MRIAFLCKRRYMGKDVILDRYARLYEIPYQLARRGHVVRGFCLSYHGDAEGVWAHEAEPGQLTWESRSPGRSVLPALATYPRHLLRQLRAFAPDVLIAASDIPHVALGAWLARRLHVPYAADLYDNFEGFGQARLPGMVSLLRRAVRRADLVTTTSEPLRELVVDTYRARGKVLAMPSTVDKAVFRPLDRQTCRRSLGLPEGARLVGTAGGLHRDKGVDTLYAAWPAIAAAAPDAHLVLAGPSDSAFPPPADERVHYLGELPHARTAELFNALDVGVIYLRDTAFGRYCFPQKAYEMLACHLPIVAARIGVMPQLLASTPDGLYHADDAADLARAVLVQLTHPQIAQVPIDDWSQLIGRLDGHLRVLVGAHAAPA
ncbi:MAG: glycosyltransferase family 4 protein [Xanthomonadales bacterium]|nr:glycosyltransferase family 4 protein [Xanthomonadales bacterium]